MAFARRIQERESELLSKIDEALGRIDQDGYGECDVAFGDPVAEIRLGLAASLPATEPGAQAAEKFGMDRAQDGVADADEVGEEAAPSPTASDGAAAVEIEETRILRVALAPGESDRYWLHADGSEFVAEVARWTIRELLDAVVEDFQAGEKEETDETPEAVEVDDTDDSDETDDTRKDDAEGAASEARQGDGGGQGDSAKGEAS